MFVLVKKLNRPKPSEKKDGRWKNRIRRVNVLT